MSSSLSASAGAAARPRRSALRAGGRWSALVLLLAAFTFLARAQEGNERTVTVSAHKYAFSPARLEVRQDDLVRVTF
ncbi:MAG: hypothetical protein ABIS29_03325, partial [Vicinamibacterales bacterium]